MTSGKQNGLGTLSTLSIGIGGMVGGGIFAVTGLAVEVTRGAAPLAFALAGAVALLTSYSYLRLSLRFPGEGGTVDFLNRAFGDGLLTGAANILLLMSYVVLLAVYAYAFGSYGASFFPEPDRPFWLHVLTSGVIVGLVLLNAFGAQLVIRSENFMNAAKLVLLAVFVVGGLATPMEWSRLAPGSFVTPLGLVAGAMLIFLNYEGFELIANASGEVADPRRSLPIAYLGGIALVIALYVLIAMVLVGHLGFGEVARVSDHALSVAAQDFLGRPGFIAIAVAALLATSSAINATFFSTGRLAYIIARSRELPVELERSIRGQHLEGTLLTAAAGLAIANLVPLEAIATMGSAGFLLLFTAVNAANVRLSRETGGHAWISAVAAATTGLALVALCIQVDENPATRRHLWILAGMIALALGIEAAYRRATGRRLHWIGTPLARWLPAGGKRIFQEITIRTSLDALWEALTNPDLTERYWFGTRIESDWRVGSTIRYLRDGELTDEHRILSVEPPRSLRHTFRPVFGEYRKEAPSRVTFRMAERDGAVVLTVVHDHFPPRSRVFVACSDGWPRILSSLKSFLETGEPRSDA